MKTHPLNYRSRA